MEVIKQRQRAAHFLKVSEGQIFAMSCGIFGAVSPGSIARRVTEGAEARRLNPRPAWPIHPDFTVGSSNLHAPGARCAPMGTQSLNGNLMKSSVTNLVTAFGLVAIGVALAAAGIYIGDTDDAPGAALIGIVLMIGMVALGVRIARRKT
jgi:hypothetical protein